MGARIPTTSDVGHWSRNDRLFWGQMRRFLRRVLLYKYESGRHRGHPLREDFGFRADLTVFPRITNITVGDGLCAVPYTLLIAVQSIFSALLRIQVWRPLRRFAPAPLEGAPRGCAAASLPRRGTEGAQQVLRLYANTPCGVNRMGCSLHYYTLLYPASRAAHYPRRFRNRGMTLTCALSITPEASPSSDHSSSGGFSISSSFA